MDKKHWWTYIGLFFAGIMAGIIALMRYGTDPDIDKKRGEIEGSLDKIKQSKSKVDKAKTSLANKYGKKISVFIFAMMVSVTVYAKYEKTVSGDVFDFGSCNNYVSYLEEYIVVLETTIETNSMVAVTVSTQVDGLVDAVRKSERKKSKVRTATAGGGGVLIGIILTLLLL